MDHANPAAKSMDYGSFSDEDLIRRYCSDPPDRDAGEELARRCLSKLSDFVRRQVFGKGICPPGHSVQIFFEDSCDLAIENFTRGIRSYRSEGDLDAWLNRICINAVLTIWRKHVGRGEEPNPMPVPIETKDKPEESLLDHAIFESKYWIDPTALIQEKELETVVKFLLTKHTTSSKHGRSSAHAIAYRCWDELQMKDIATLMQCSTRTVDRLLTRDFESLRNLFETEFGVTDADQL